MVKKSFPVVEVTLEKIVGGGQTLGTLADGRKLFVWGGLPGETVKVQITKKKSHFAEGTVTEVISKSPERTSPPDPASYLSTSPWQIMTFEAEQHYKAALIEEAFELHDIVLPHPIEIYSDGRTAHYRNKVEFSWYSTTADDTGTAETLDLAFFRRGSKGKITIDECSLLPAPMMQLARNIRDYLQSRHVSARQLKTLLIRSDQQNNLAWQLYLKQPVCDFMSAEQAATFTAQGGEVIYSDPRSPASVITERLFAVGNPVLSDTILDVPFHYATEGFFQVNIPVYEHALRDMEGWVSHSSGRQQLPAVDSDLRADSRGIGDDGSGGKKPEKTVIDLYSGVGTIGLTIGGKHVKLIEINEHAVREMRRNISQLGRKGEAEAILAASEDAVEHITVDAIVIVDPPRAGLHQKVIQKLLETKPARIIYLSCNPVTQARDVAYLAEAYGVRHHHGYNFFPRTPHIEHLVVLDLI